MQQPFPPTLSLTLSLSPSLCPLRLVLSNGLVNYLKLYLKREGDRVINVQEGYNSLPTTGQIPQIETLYYIADERGYRVLRSEYFHFLCCSSSSASSSSTSSSLFPSRAHSHAGRVAHPRASTAA